MTEIGKGKDVIYIDEETFQTLKEIEALAGGNVDEMAAFLANKGVTTEEFQKFMDEYGLNGNPAAEEIKKEFEIKRSSSPKQDRQ